MLQGKTRENSINSPVVIKKQFYQDMPKACWYSGWQLVLQLELAILFFKLNPESRRQNGEANGSLPGTILFTPIAGTYFDSDIPHLRRFRQNLAFLQSMYVSNLSSTAFLHISSHHLIHCRVCLKIVTINPSKFTG